MTAPEVLVRELSQFQEPGAFVQLFERARAGLARKEIYRNPKYQYLKDAWQGGMFALGYQEHRRQLAEVRICVPEQFPDFQLRVAEQAFDFEATIVLQKGRRMGDEFREDKATGPVQREKPEELEPFDLEGATAAIAKKARKHYGSRPHLCVYLNTQGRNVLLSDLASKAQEADGNQFESIWFLSDHYIGCGKQSSILPAPEGWFRIPIK